MIRGHQNKNYQGLTLGIMSGIMASAHQASQNKLHKDIIEWKREKEHRSEKNISKLPALI